ncbi:MAG: hypothetical protein E6Q97_25625 [Desulfurellales bacterium]|nr:MAG: hypothetical protein E6Q97_25625 [Desulfurellales bacterium]
MSIFKFANNRKERKAHLIAHATILGKEIADLRKQLTDTTDGNQRNLLNLRIRKLQRQWLSQIRALAQEYNQ